MILSVAVLLCTSVFEQPMTAKLAEKMQGKEKSSVLCCFIRCRHGALEQGSPSVEQLSGQMLRCAEQLPGENYGRQNMTYA